MALNRKAATSGSRAQNKLAPAITKRPQRVDATRRSRDLTPGLPCGFGSINVCIEPSKALLPEKSPVQKGMFKELPFESHRTVAASLASDGWWLNHSRYLFRLTKGLGPCACAPPNDPGAEREKKKARHPFVVNVAHLQASTLIVIREAST